MRNLLFLTLFVISNTLLAGPIRSYSPELALAKINFLENKGQHSEQVKYHSNLKSGSVFFENNQVVYNLLDFEAIEMAHEGKLQRKADEKSLIKGHSYSTKFIGANSTSSIAGYSTNQTYSNFYIGDDESKWASYVREYRQLKYSNLYKNTDLYIYSEGSSLKYDYVIKPGGDPRDIQIEYTGLDSIQLSQNQLYLYTTVNTLIEDKPYAYQIINGQKIEVPCLYKLTRNIVSFEFPQGYDKNIPLIIDPFLIFSTYSGSTSDNWGNTATYDKYDHGYSGGIVFGSGYPASPGAYSTSFSGIIDIAIIKYDSTGENRLYATYIGGSDTDIAQSMIVDSSDNLIVLGVSGSSNFPTTTGAYDQIFGGGFETSPLNVYWQLPLFGSTVYIDYSTTFENGSDIVLFKLNPDGSNLLSSTYFGGSSNDGILYSPSEYDAEITANYGDQYRSEVIVDDSNNIYVVSQTSSSGLGTSGSYDPTYNGGLHDAIIFKMSTNLDTLKWSSYFGGTRSDAGYSIELNDSNQVLICGGTNSLAIPVTNGTGYQGNTDGFAAVFSNDGSQLISSGYFGTTAYDQAFFIREDANGDIYLLGQTSGDYTINQPDGYYKKENGGQFLHKINKSLDTTRFSTRIGSGSGSPDYRPTAFLVNDCGLIYLSGWGGGSNFSSFNESYLGIQYTVYTGYIGGSTDNLEITSNAFQNTTDGSDFYFGVFNRDMQNLLYGTYFGGSITREHVDGGTSRFDDKGVIYQSVCASCGGHNGNDAFPTYPNPGAWSNVNGSDNCNNALVKFDLATIVADFDLNKICYKPAAEFENNSVGGEYFIWIFGDGNRDTTRDRSGIEHEYDSYGEFELCMIAQDLNTCKGTDTICKNIFITGLPEPFKQSDTLCLGQTIELDGAPQDTSNALNYSWKPGDYLSDSTSKNVTVDPSENIEYFVTITDTNGCSTIDTFKITLDEIVANAFVSILGSCLNEPNIKIENTTSGFEPIEYKWVIGNSDTINEKEPNTELITKGLQKVVMVAENGFCKDTFQTEVFVEDIYVPNVFTPNGDGVNDTYQIIGIENTGNWHVEFYDRWGVKIRDYESYENLWDGENVREGTYYYLITSPDKTICKGWVKIMR